MPEATKIMIIRHAEKPDDTTQGIDAVGSPGKEFLTVRGWQRAGALARFFAPADAKLKRPGIETPQFLFASGPLSKEQKQDTGDGSKSFRPEQTITPLAKLLGSKVPFNLTFVEGDEAQMAASATQCGGVVLISWQHEKIPTIADAILGKSGIAPSKWPGNRFDLVWVFDLQPDGKYSFSQVPQMLLAGDSPV